MEKEKGKKNNEEKREKEENVYDCLFIYNELKNLCECLSLN